MLHLISLAYARQFLLKEKPFLFFVFVYEVFVVFYVFIAWDCDITTLFPRIGLTYCLCCIRSCDNFFIYFTYFYINHPWNKYLYFEQNYEKQYKKQEIIPLLLSLLFLCNCHPATAVANHKFDFIAVRIGCKPHIALRCFFHIKA